MHNEQESQALLCPPSLQRPAARAPCSLQSGVQFLPSAPASPTHRPRSPRGRLARPAPAAETEGTPGDPWTGRGLSAGDPALRAMPPGWSRARLRKPQAGRRAGATEAGFILAPAAHWGRLGGGRGTGKNWRRRSVGVGGCRPGRSGGFGDIAAPCVHLSPCPRWRLMARTPGASCSEAADTQLIEGPCYTWGQGWVVRDT